MKVIGLTGNIGCGKSTVAGMLRRRGVATIDADEVAREVRETDAAVREAILGRFGTLDRRELGDAVFSDRRLLADLEAIVHPAVRRVVVERLNDLERVGVDIVAIEAIKLLESPLRERCDAVWVVRCDEAEAVERAARSRGVPEADVLERLANQSPQAEKVAAADTVIDGSVPLEQTDVQVAAALEELRG